MVILGHLHQLAAVVDVLVGCAVFYISAGSETCVVVGVVPPGRAVSGHGCQLAAMFPGEVPSRTVIVAGGIADVVVGDGLAIDRRQQVTSAGIISAVLG